MCCGNSILQKGLPFFYLHKIFYTLEKGFLIDNDELENLLLYWKKMNIIKSEEAEIDQIIKNKNYQKYDRQIKNFATLPNLTAMNGIKYQDKLADCTITIVGIGGVGSYVAYGLAAIGIKQLNLIEGDIVELSNTSRQILYLEKDIGFPKINIAEKKLLEISSSIKINKFNEFVSKDNLDQIVQFVGESDLIIQCADTPRDSIEYLIDEISEKSNVPWLTFAPYAFSKIFLGPLIIPNVTRTLSEMIPNISKNNSSVVKRINNNFSPTIMDPYNGIAAKMALIEVVKFITGYTKSSVIDQRIVLDTETWEIEKYDL